MQKIQTRPNQPVMRLNEHTLRGFAGSQQGAGELRVFVAHTSRELTKAALDAVLELTRDLGARVTLFAVQIVPFPLPLERPDVSPKFVEQELTGMAREIEVRVDIEVVITRDLDVGLQRVLTTSSLVVVAAKKRLWPTAELRLARALAQAGHSVALLAI